MAIKLNLLPEGFGAPGELGKILRITRMLGVIALGFFIVFTVGVSAFFIFSTISLNSVKSQNDSLKSQIAAQESTESQLILLKDRLGKIKTILGAPTAAKNLVNVTPLLSSIGGSSTLSELDVDSQKVGMSVVFTSNTELSAFLRSVEASKNFSKVVLSNFNLSPTTGFTVELNLTK